MHWGWGCTSQLRQQDPAAGGIELRLGGKTGAFHN